MPNPSLTVSSSAPSVPSVEHLERAIQENPREVALFCHNLAVMVRLLEGAVVELRGDNAQLRADVTGLYHWRNAA